MNAKDINLSKLSRETNIPIGDLKKIINGTFQPQEPRVLTMRPYTLEDQIEDMKRGVVRDLSQVNETEHLSQHEPEPLTPFEQLASLEEPDELHHFLSGLSFDDEVFVTAYEKLTAVLDRELAQNPDKEHLNELNDYAPSGSPQELEIMKRIDQYDLEEIQSENDFDELVNWYKDNEYSSTIKKVLAQKIVSFCTTIEDAQELEDNVFPDESPEYYEIIKKQLKLIHEAISKANTEDDIRSLADAIYDDADEMILLAHRIVEISKSKPFDIWDYEDLFPDNSEALEVLVAGVLASISHYEEDSDGLLETVLESFGDSSRIGRQVTKLRSTLWTKHIEQITDAEALKEALDETKSSNLVRVDLEKQVVQLIDDKDELNELTNNETHLGQLAKEKLLNILRTERSTTLNISDIQDQLDYIDSPSMEEYAVELRLAELVKTPDEATDLGFTDASFAMYTLAKKFCKPVVHQATTLKSVPVVISTQSVAEVNSRQVLENTIQELRDKDRDIRTNINRSTTVESVMNLYQTLPQDSEYRQLAYKKATALLDSELYELKDAAIGLQLLYCFPKKSSEWLRVITELSRFYKKPWYQFW